MASVRKRILPSGETRWQVDYRDQDGTRRAKQFERKADAVSFETTVRAELKAGTHVAERASITVAEAGDLWLLACEKGLGERDGTPLEAGTLRQYRQHLKFHIVPFLGDRKVSTLTAPDIESFRDRLVETRSRSMTRAVLTSLKGILKEALRLRKTNVDPASSVKMGRKRRRKQIDGEGETGLKMPSKDELRLLLDKTVDMWPLTKNQTSRKHENKVVAICWRPFIVTAIFTGMRCSELRGLTWNHVDFDNRTIHVRQRADFQNTMGPPKSEAGNRDIPMTPMVFNTLREWKLACPRTPLNLVFPTENGLIHSNSNIHKQCWGPLQLAAGIVEQDVDASGQPILRPRYTFHSLRHAAASLFIAEGWNPKRVQTVMGHSSIQVTYDVYGAEFKDRDEKLQHQDDMVRMEARLLRPVS